MIKKLIEVNGDISKLKSWEKRSYHAYQINEIHDQLMTASQSEKIMLIRNHILNGHPKDFGASCIDIYLVAFVAENYGLGKQIFFDYKKSNGITDKDNSAQAFGKSEKVTVYF